jgi:hypothetical protein
MFAYTQCVALGYWIIAFQASKKNNLIYKVVNNDFTPIGKRCLFPALPLCLFPILIPKGRF